MLLHCYFQSQQPVLGPAAQTWFRPVNEAMHRAVRDEIAMRLGEKAAAEIRILYGGSVNAGNANAIFSLQDVDGGLIGGASLKPDDFLAIIAAACSRFRPCMAQR